MARSPMARIFSAATLCSVVLFALAGCAGGARKGPLATEDFDSTTTHSRSYGATEAQSCEAARRALLSQGYQINTATVESVIGRKSFQPSAEVHLEVEFRVTCARERPGPAEEPHTAIVFVTALQERYGLKKSNNSASVGVGVLGSLSLPFSSSDDALVKIASQTLTDEHFYDRFFELMGRFLQAPGKPAAGAAPAASVVPAAAAAAAAATAVPLPPAEAGAAAASEPAVRHEEAPVSSPVLRQPLPEVSPLPNQAPLAVPAATPPAVKDPELSGQPTRSTPPAPPAQDPADAAPKPAPAAPTPEPTPDPALPPAPKILFTT